MKKKVLGSLLCCSLAYSCQAFSVPPFISTLKQGHLLVQAGGFWNNQGKAQHIDIDGLIGDDFTVTKNNDANGLAGLGYFIEGQDLNRFRFDYGVNAFYLGKTSVSGTIIQEELFTNLSYDYDVTNIPIYLVAKAHTNLPINRLSLIVDAGIGPNFMRTGNFIEHSVDEVITYPDYIFSGHRSTNFSATAGVSIQLANALRTLPLECGYRFFYLGQGHFSQTTDQQINNLHTGFAYANAVVCATRI